MTPTPSERVAQARELVLDGMQADCLEVIKIGERDVDALIAAVTQEVEARCGERVAALEAEVAALAPYKAFVEAIDPCVTDTCVHYEWSECGKVMHSTYRSSPLAAFAKATGATPPAERPDA